MSVGERLLAARLDTGLTLEQIAGETKVSRWILDAIERDDLSRVPGGVFLRGYLTSFADAVGLEPADLLAAYAQEHPQPQPPVLPPPPEPTQHSDTSRWQIVAIAAIVLGVAVMGRHISHGDADPRPGPTSPPLVTAPQSVPKPETREAVPAATTGSGQSISPVDTSDAVHAAAPGAALVVAIHATDDAWIDATTDGERKAYRLFTRGEDLRLEAQKEIRLRVGNAGGVTYTINGKPARSIGGPGIVRDIVISPDTYTSLVAADAPFRP